MSNYSREGDKVALIINVTEAEYRAIVEGVARTKAERQNSAMNFPNPALSREQYESLNQRMRQSDLDAYNALVIIQALENMKGVLYLAATKYPQALDEQGQLREDWLERMVSL